MKQEESARCPNCGNLGNSFRTVEGRKKQTVPQRMFEYYGLARLLYQQPVLPLALILQPQAGGLHWHNYKETLFGHELVRFRYGQVGLRDLPADEYITRDDPVAAALSVLMKPGEGLRGRARWAKLGELKVKAILKVNEGVRHFCGNEVAQSGDRPQQLSGHPQI